ncbi:DUF1906 domain-containing protein [Streptomyces sp. NPDC021224]|uniref:DUF1906 domain-containing protein n=1 Tax=unclassified Streptomyces TaxID=2593676 RepID=UPI0037B6892A
MTTAIPGVDYAWSHPGGAALKEAGKRFAARYLSNGATKNISRAEADDLAAHGLSVVVVWESTERRPLDGRAAGIADAKLAAVQATAAGMPVGRRPIYFAVDFDATAAQLPTVMAYLDGAASVLGRDRVGVYGGYDTVRAALDGGHAAWAWQTRAWSAGRWDPRAHIRQGATATIGGVSCDLNTALVEDFGQWTPGHVPSLEDDMPTEAQIWAYKNTKSGDDRDAHQYVKDAASQAAAALAQARQNGSGLSALAAKVDKLAATAAPEIDYAKLAAALLAALKEG